jgi:hypothetical protein
MTKQLFGLFFGWVWRPSLCDGLIDQDTIGLPHPSLIILGHKGEKKEKIKKHWVLFTPLLVNSHGRR